MTPDTTLKPEYRSITAEAPILAEDGTTLDGLAVRWMSLSTNPKVMERGGKKFAFWERVAPGAFADSLASGEDVGCYVDHEPSKILGRISAGSLDVWEDDDGLRFRCRIGFQSYAMDLRLNLKDGNVRGCSFGMFVLEDKWEDGEDGLKIRTILRAKLFDVSPVSIPTYEDTEIALRSFDRHSALLMPTATARDPWLDQTRERLDRYTARGNRVPR